MCDLSNISVVLPSLDPDEKLIAVVDGLLSVGFSDIILVNDGSKPENLHYFLDLESLHPEIHLLHHEINKGKGAALKNAFRYFLDNRPQGLGVVTVDGDNQHHPEDTLACCKHLLETGRVTLGCRDFSLEHVPPRSRFGNRTTSAIFRIFVGMVLSDTQTGLRAIPRGVLEQLMDVAGDRFEYETNMLLAFKEKGIPFDEVKIRTVYIEENKSSHFRVLHDSWRIYKLILAHFFRYTLSSLLCALADTTAYSLLSFLFAPILTGVLHTAAAAIPARIFSSLLNFFINKRLVFKAKADTKKALVRYYCLALPQMAAQVLLTQGAYALLSIGDSQGFLRTLVYAIVMAALYVLSFVIQQRWVFAPQKSE